jgi:hypothetical protein
LVSHASVVDSLFVSDEVVSVVLQNSEGQELHFTVGDQDDATLSWADFQTTVCKDLEEQKYSKSVSECLGVLGDRFIMEVGRINEDGDVYMEAFSLVTINSDGKIIMIEGFSDVNAEGLVHAVE